MKYFTFKVILHVDGNLNPTAIGLFSYETKTIYLQRTTSKDSFLNDICELAKQEPLILEYFTPKTLTDLGYPNSDLTKILGLTSP